MARRADAIAARRTGSRTRCARSGRAARVEVIENACDFEDFDGLQYRPGERFRLTHTGSFAGRRDARPFFEALARQNGDIVARFVGGLRAPDLPYVRELGLGDRLEIVPFQPYSRVRGSRRTRTRSCSSSPRPALPDG